MRSGRTSSPCPLDGLARGAGPTGGLSSPGRGSEPLEMGMRVDLGHFASGEDPRHRLNGTVWSRSPDHITVTVERGRLVFNGAARLPDCDLDAGLRAVLESLRDQGWEIDPDQSRASDPVLLRRRRVTGPGADLPARHAA